MNDPCLNDRLEAAEYFRCFADSELENWIISGEDPDDRVDPDVKDLAHIFNRIRKEGRTGIVNTVFHVRGLKKIFDDQGKLKDT